MKTLLFVLSVLASPAVVMSEQTTTLASSADSVSVLAAPLALINDLYAPVSQTAALLTDNKEVDCLARTVYFEARGEPVAGQMAVASVVLARVVNAEFPDTVCEVVTEARKPGRFHCQFTWWCDGRPDEPQNAQEYRQAKGVALLALLLGPQPGGPTHFHAADMKPQWNMEQIATIGGHVFYN